MNPPLDGPLFELCSFARIACGASLVLALEVDDEGRASPVASSPPHHFAGFNLGKSGIFGHEWLPSSLPIGANGFRLPAAVVHAMADRPAGLLFVPAPVDHAPKSGLLLFWPENSVPAPLIKHVQLLAGSVATTLATRREAAMQKAMRDQFNDLLESVPSGIILFDGDGQNAMINERAAELLACRSGAHRARDLAAPMRTLRARCDNRVQLDTAYAAQVGNVDYALSIYWVVGQMTYEVDTHPVNGDGQYGRIWLFTDVTAELQMAAKLRGLAESDPLTGLPNRRHFQGRSAQIMARAELDGRVVSLLMVDVDRFKQINDTYGHLVGDEVLKTVATRCRGVLRDADLFARFGGEEFISLLVSSSADEVPLVAERIRSAVANAAISVGDLRIHVSVSVGAASTTAFARVADGAFDTLIAKADAALYRAKQSGRNRVIVADP